MSASAVSSNDRLTFTIFVACMLHAILIFGVVFTAPRVNMPHVMEVTLAQHRSKTTDKNADFLADANQQGSGDLDRAELITSPHQSRFHDQSINEIQPEESQVQTQAATAQQKQVLTTTTRSTRVVDTRKSREQREAQAESREAQLAMAWQSDDIASLQARLAAKKQAYAKRPRVRAVSTVSTRYDRDAAYVDAFRSRVEEIGNKNYPALARQRKIYGNVRLMVAILPTGQIKEIITLKSSGHAILDEAARQSVRLAAPFQPFPAAIRRDTDILQIIRTWKFAERLSNEG
ncbi:MAG TPA: energy transducer TonB [Moraxellaceae bacterium]|nr:energy transducer TonB [Moraxellaceae bacterium]